jgi:hypothetical protein
MTISARTREQRIADTLHRLDTEVDCWVATADGSSPWLVPLSFLWDGESLLIATPVVSPTSRNMQASGKVRLGIGPTRDLVLIDGMVRALADGELTDEVGGAFATKTGFDPRELTTPYLYFRVVPQRIQAWREANELDGRDLMRDGYWLATG